MAPKHIAYAQMSKINDYANISSDARCIILSPYIHQYSVYACREGPGICADSPGPSLLTEAIDT